jgi:hypothetical protein
MPSGNRLATWDGALRDMRQSNASPVRTVMNNHAAGPARQPLTDSCWNTSCARKKAFVMATSERPPCAAEGAETVALPACKS